MNIKQIISKKDPLIQEMLRMKKEKDTSLYFAEGMRVVETIAQQHPEGITYIFATKGEFLKNFKKNILPKCILISEHIMEALSHVKTAPGIIALCKYELKTGTPQAPGLVCFNISDPGNLGTLFRSASAFGAKSIICIGGVNPLHPKIIQASAGMMHAISIYKMTEKLFFDSVPQETDVIALTTTAQKEIQQLKKTSKNYFVVVGSEAHGLSKQVVDRCSFSAHIPMKGRTESLNAAIAGSIAMYELF